MITKDERALLHSKITMHFPMGLLAKLVLDGASAWEIIAYMLYYHECNMSKNDEFFCELPVDQLCMLSGSSKSTINRVNASLIKKGWLYRNTKDVKAVRSSSGTYSQDVSKTFPCIPEKYKQDVLHSNPIRTKRVTSKKIDDLNIGSIQSASGLHKRATSPQRTTETKIILSTELGNREQTNQLPLLEFALNDSMEVQPEWGKTERPSKKFQFSAIKSSSMTAKEQRKIQNIKACTTDLNAKFIELALKRNDPSLLYFMDKTKIGVHDLNTVYEKAIEREDVNDEIKRKQSIGGDLYAINIANAKVRNLIREKLQKFFQSRLSGEVFERRERLVCWLYEKHSENQSLNPSKQIDLLLQIIKNPSNMGEKQDSMPYDYEPLPDDIINHIEYCRQQHQRQLLAA